MKGRLSPRDVLALGLLGVRSRRLRAALSALGISIGIATVVIVTGIPASSHAALQARLTALGTNVLTAQAIADSDNPVVLPRGAAAMVQRIAPVTRVTAVGDTHRTVQRTPVRNQGEGAGISVLATSGDLLRTLNTRLRAGRYLDAVSANFPEAVLGQTAAEFLGIDELRRDQPAPAIYVDGTWFTVIGILDATPLSSSIAASVLVGWPVARRVLGFDGHPTAVYLQCAENQLTAVSDVVGATLYPPAAGLVQVSRPSDALAAKQAADRNYSSLFLGLAVVALAVGGIGVANTMVIGVLERRREIGLRRALGATRGQIRAQFLTEAVLLATLGGLVGSGSGALATLAYAEYQRWPVVIPGVALVVGTLGAAAVGALAGLYPAVRASLLTPTQALNAT